MIKKISAIYSNCAINNCHQISSDEEIKIVETHSSCCVINNASNDENFLVKNPNKKALNYLAIDKCLFDDTAKHKRCDCAVFDESTFSLVEIKDSDSDNTKSKLLKKAYDQLEAVLKEFTSKSLLSDYNVEAIISFKFRPIRPLASATLQTKMVAFARKYKAKIYIGNEKIFL